MDSSGPAGPDGLIPRLHRPPIPGGPQSVPEVLAAAVARAPRSLALVDVHRRLSYEALQDEVARATSVLADAGVSAGDRLAVSMPNQAPLVVAFLAAMRLGAVWVGINRNLTAFEKAHLLDDAAPKLFIGDDKMVRQVTSSKATTPAMVADGVDAEWDRLVARASASQPAPPDPFEPAAIAYTSGTTGQPKGVVHSQHNMVLPGAVLADRGGAYGPETVNGIVLPLTILNPMILQVLTTFQVLGRVVLIDTIDPVGLARWVREERITAFMVVPAIMYDLLTSPDVRPADLETLTMAGVGGAHTPERLKQLYMEQFGRVITTGYGLTEAPTGVTRQNPKRVVPGGSGRALPHLRITIRDDSGNEVPAGSDGEICIEPAAEGVWRGVYTPMLGYWRRPDATRQALRGGVLHTGDIGHLDASGELFVTDRRTDLILRGGANVYPAEVEAVLHALPGVEEAAVVAIPDDRLGSRVGAFVRAAPGAALDPGDLRFAMLERLARYKVPEVIRLVEDFPRNAMGKVVKSKLPPLDLSELVPVSDAAT